MKFHSDPEWNRLERERKLKAMKQSAKPAQPDANLEMSIKLRLLLRALWNHCEGISSDDIKTLCWGCGIDAAEVMIPQATPDVRYDGSPDLNTHF